MALLIAACRLIGQLVGKQQRFGSQGGIRWEQMLTFGDYLAVVRRRLGWIVASMIVCMLRGAGPLSRNNSPRPSRWESGLATW